MTIEILDWRLRQPNPPPLVRGIRKHKIDPSSRRVFERDMRDVDSIVVHQTACTFGPSDDAEKRHMRALGVACHALAFRDGTAVIANPLPWLVWHGNGFNDRSLGLEIEGRFAGLEDDPRTAPDESLETTWGGEPDEATSLVIECARRALLELVTMTAAAGGEIRYVYAHRQSSSTRRADPGQALWQAVAIEYAIPVLGLKSHPWQVLSHRVKGKTKLGRPIPTQWGGTGRY